MLVQHEFMKEAVFKYTACKSVHDAQSQGRFRVFRIALCYESQA